MATKKDYGILDSLKDVAVGTSEYVKDRLPTRDSDRPKRRKPETKKPAPKKRK